MPSLSMAGLLLLVVTCGDVVDQTNGRWPGFRGPGASGVSHATGLPSEWSTSKNVAWKIDVPGVGWSCPVVWDGQLILTTAIPSGKTEFPKKGLYFGGERKLGETTYTWEVHSYDAQTGKLQWRREVRSGKPTIPIHIKNSYASETPVTDGKHIWASFGSAGVFCLDMAGNIRWSTDMWSPKMRFGWGTASSPALDDGRIFLQCDCEKDSFVAALDAATGKEIWKDKHDEISSWATPFVWKTPQRTEVVTAATKKVRSYDPATGKILWELGGMSSIAVPTPIAGPDNLIVSSGYVMDSRRPVFAIRPGAAGDISLGADDDSNRYVQWRQKLAGPYMPTPVVYNDLLYVLYDRGFIACYDARTGAVVYDKKRLGGATAFTVSPWAYDDKVFCLSEDGDTFVIAAGKEFKLLGKNALDELCMSTPAVAGGSLFVRTLTKLYCIRK